MKHEDFKINMRVSTWDEDEKEVVCGTVKEITEDAIVIKWDDLSDTTVHYHPEFPQIQPIKRN